MKRCAEQCALQLHQTSLIKLRLKIACYFFSFKINVEVEVLVQVADNSYTKTFRTL